MEGRESTLREAAGWLRAARRLVVFTGAGVSAESGIATFRDAAGFWRRFPPEQFATWGGLLKTATVHPTRLAEFLLEVLEPVALAAPNAGHRTIAQIEKHTQVTVITQNIDRLHHDAGSRTVHEVHGSLFEIISARGHFVRVLSRAEMLEIVHAIRRAERGHFSLPRLLLAIRPIYGLGAGVVHRPRIVLFGDAMAEPDWELAQAAAENCDCFLTVGTSGVVMPAAMLPHEARLQGAPVIGIGPEEGDSDIWLHGRAGEVLPRLVREAFGR
jgi:NAD-dependent deacetylase